MTNMSITPGTAGDVDTIAQDAGLSAEQAVRFRGSVASWVMENMRPTEQEMRLGAEILAGRITFEEYRRRLGIQRSAASLQNSAVLAQFAAQASLRTCTVPWQHERP